MTDASEGRDERYRDDVESRRIVERIYAGERDLVAVLYERHFPRLYAFLCSVMTVPADAEDIAHQVFEALLAGLSSNALRDVSSLRGWLFAVARNRAADHRRRHGRVDVTAPDEIAHRAAAERDSKGRDPLSTIFDPDLAAAVRRLPPLQREVLALRYVADCDSGEVATIMGTSTEAVRQAQRRAISALRERLAGPESGGDGPSRLAMRRLRYSDRTLFTGSFSLARH